LIYDIQGVVVKEGDVIKFPRSNRLYHIIQKNGDLGAYENGEFIALKDVLKSFQIMEE
jgi:hypothetical protein